jgi:hypothetical protein
MHTFVTAPIATQPPPHETACWSRIREERIMSQHRDKRALVEGLFSGEEFGSCR